MDEATIAEITKQQFLLSKTALGAAVERGIPIQIPDVQSDPSSLVLDVVVRAGYRALLFVPLLGVGEVVGALVVRRKHPGEFPKGTIQLLQTFAAQSVLAIQNARLFEEIQDKSQQLEVASKYKSHFLASASHDLRQPLHALNLFVAQLNAELDSVERRRLVGRIEAAVGSMNELFDALLDMSKLEAGILEPNVTVFPIDHLLRRIETTFADAAREKGIRLLIAPSSAWVRSDFILLERILLNLVSNAVRYTARGGVLVGCRRRGERLRIDVCDTGPGIPAEQQRKVFSEFYQLAESDRGHGLGLGLAIVDRLGGLLGHPVELRSLLGRGSRFSVSVPATAQLPSVAEESIASAIVDPAHGKLVLVIDDDPLVVEAMSGILRSWGCKVLCTNSEEAALFSVTAQRQRPDLIIADYRLAGRRTGIQAIAAVRSAVGLSIPAFLISGDTAPDRLRDARKNGFHLLHKPVPAMRLRAILNQLLRSRDIPLAAE
jgi:signal transduction histidine kinase/CheY-like chemotaxis protein